MAKSGVNPLSPSAAFGGSSIPTIAGIGRGNVTSDINVTPMVDVMLVLLIIFMVITPVLATYDTELPEAEHVVPEPDDDVVTLGIDAQGVYHVAGATVSPERLAPTLRSIYAARTDDHLLYLRADRSISYDVVLSAIDAARAAGVRTIGAITVPVELDGR